jgi:myosin-1
VTCLANRYNQDWIYTNIGPVLIAINPFKMIAAYYTDAKIREYKGKKAYELPPHVYALADDAYSNMIGYRENQCVIITGESGSGKTETSKIIMQYVSGVSGKSVEVLRVKDRMLASNPLLEGFGNAKTVNNNNSSRFGKYMEILFDYGGDPVGGRVTNYLLEKSRVVGPSQGERNFHIFYQICAGSSAQDKQNYCIEKPDYYYYLSCSNCYQVPGIDDNADYREMMEAMQTVGVTHEEIQEVIRVTSAILWLGNVSFKEPRPEQAQVADRQVLDIVAGLLQVNSQALEQALCFRQIQTGVGAKAEKFTKPNTAAASDFSRDTLSKALYSRMFDYLVHKINISIKKDNFQGIQIGVLDICNFIATPATTTLQLL